MPKLSQRAANVPDSGIRAVFELAAKMDNVIDLSVGEPSLPVSEHVKKAGADAWLRDDLSYTANQGIDELRETLAQKLRTYNGYTVDPDQINVAAGGSQALNVAMSMALDPGDEILVPDPGYATFFMTPMLMSATPVAYHLDPEDGFLPRLDVLEGLVTEKTKAILINSPSNPLGTVIPPALIEQIMDFAKRHDLWVISDEVYEHILFEDAQVPFTSPAVFDTDGRVMSVYSLSKSYALTGARLGYLVLPKGHDVRFAAVQEANASCVNTPSQYAAIAAVAGPQDDLEAARDHYTENRRAALEVLDELGLEYVNPAGGFYLFVNVSHDSAGDVGAWAQDFLREHRVAVAPGTAFGSFGEGWVRVCFAGDRDALVEGLRRFPAKNA